MPLSAPRGLTLYFCRHGETVANVEHRFQGRTRDTPLTDKGRRQAAAIGDALKDRDPGFAKLNYVCSPLRRAQTTMEIIRQSIGLPREGYALDDRLMEIDLGLWDGLTDAEASARYPEEFAKRVADKWNVPALGGENYAQVANRAESWVNDLDTDTFAVSHGAFTRILRGLFQGLDWQHMSALDEKQGVLFRVRGHSLERFDVLA